MGLSLVAAVEQKRNDLKLMRRHATAEVAFHERAFAEYNAQNDVSYASASYRPPRGPTIVVALAMSLKTFEFT